MVPSKSYVAELAQVWTLLLQEVDHTYPALRTEWERDSTRFQSLVRTRGLHFLAVDLPAVAKHLDRCLDDGQYIASGLATTSCVSRTVRFPKFLRGLYLLIFDKTGRLREDCDVTAIIFLRQLLLVGKKVKVACSTENTLSEIDEFLVVDQALSDPPKGWISSDPYEVTGCFLFAKDPFYVARLKEGDHHVTPKLLDILDKVVKCITSSLGHYDHTAWKFKHGPGAVAERTGSVNKYKFVNWSDRLDTVFPYCDVAFHSYTAWVDAVNKRTSGSIEPVSRLIAVPKTLTKPRLIAVEPSEHQWCQQNMLNYFSRRSEKSWLNSFVAFRSQELNQRLCVKASADGSLCTLDLSAASDRVTCRVVQSMFWRLPSLLHGLVASRTRSVELPDKSIICLKKFSTMGNACTFPVESLTFLAASLASTLYQRDVYPSQENICGLIGEVAVFGDDIVIPKDSREVLVSLLEFLEFKVNTAKSFSGSNFRESCGVDAFRGQVVTPVYWKEPNSGRPGSVASVVDTHNNFYRRGYCRVAHYLASTIRKHESAYVPAESGVFGLHSRLMPNPLLLYKSRWNKDLQLSEVLIPQIKSRQVNTVDEDDSVLLQFFTEDPQLQYNWMPGFKQRMIAKIRLSWVALESLSSLGTGTSTGGEGLTPLP